MRPPTGTHAVGCADAATAALHDYDEQQQEQEQLTVR